MNQITEPSSITPDQVAGEVHEVFGRHGTMAVISPEERKAHYARILERQEEDRKRALRRDTNRWWREASLTGVVVALTATIIIMMPLKQLYPVFMNINRNDGTWAVTNTAADLSTTERAAVTKATLWLYTTSRERFNTSTHFHTDQQVVYMLSDKATGDTFEEIVNLRNKQSPWVKYGTRTTVRLERISEVLSCAAQECDSREPDAYQVRYRRIEKTEGQPERSRQWTSTMRFRTVPNIPAWQQTTMNPLKLQVTEYVAQEEGAGQ